MSLSLAHVVPPTAVFRDQTWGKPIILLGSQRLQRAATPTGQEDRAVDNYTSSLSAGVVTENIGFVGASVARETHAISHVRISWLILAFKSHSDLLMTALHRNSILYNS